MREEYLLRHGQMHCRENPQEWGAKQVLEEAQEPVFMTLGQARKYNKFWLCRVQPIAQH
jgi:hypothetical protein